MVKNRAKKIKIAAKSKPLASQSSSLHVLIKEDMEQIEDKDRGLVVTYMVRPASESDPILLLKWPNNE